MTAGKLGSGKVVCPQLVELRRGPCILIIDSHAWLPKPEASP